MENNEVFRQDGALRVRQDMETRRIRQFRQPCGKGKGLQQAAPLIVIFICYTRVIVVKYPVSRCLAVATGKMQVDEGTVGRRNIECLRQARGLFQMFDCDKIVQKGVSGKNLSIKFFGDPRRPVMWIAFFDIPNHRFAGDNVSHMFHEDNDGGLIPQVQELLLGNELRHVCVLVVGCLSVISCFACVSPCRLFSRGPAPHGCSRRPCTSDL